MNRLFLTSCILVVLTLRSLSAQDAPSEFWNQFRGPSGDGQSTSTGLPIEFSETKNVKWKTPIEGAGWSSPVVWENQVWLTAGSDESNELFAFCLDLETGEYIHRVKVFDVIKTPQSNYGYRSPHLNSPASPTPVVEDGRLYVSFGTQGIACLDTSTGSKVWERRDLHCDHVVRPGSSPIVDEERLYLAFDGVDKQFFVALDKQTGDTCWLQDRNVDTDWAETLRARGIDPDEMKKDKPGDNKKSYATATIIEHEGRRQLIAPAAEAMISYSPATGEELWRVYYKGGFNVASRPIYSDGLLYVYTSGLIGHLLAVRPDGSGDVTESHVEWITQRSTPHIPSPVIVEGRMYMTTTSGIARCLDASSGEEISKTRIGGEHWASPVYANGALYFSNKKGDVTVLSASDSLESIAENQLNGSFIASPAVAGDSLLLRSTDYLYCIANGFERSAEVVAAEMRSSESGGQVARQFEDQRIQAFVEAGEMTVGEAQRVQQLGQNLEDMVVEGKLSKEDALDLYSLALGIPTDRSEAKPESQRKTTGPVNFYAIVIGELKTKDFELGEFTIEVNYVTSMYGNRWVKDEITGKTLTVKGVAGEFLDRLLKLRRGETVKIRTGSYEPDNEILNFGSKFQVLERTDPFDPAKVGVPPDAFRGFHGTLVGKIIEVGGFEALVEISSIDAENERSRAENADSIQGRRVRLVGFYNHHDELFGELHEGDEIRVGARHANQTFDEFEVTEVLEILER